MSCHVMSCMYIVLRLSLPRNILKEGGKGSWQGHRPGSIMGIMGIVEKYFLFLTYRNGSHLRRFNAGFHPYAKSPPQPNEPDEKINT